MKSKFNENREGIAIGFGVGLLIFYLYYKHLFLESLLTPLLNIFTTKRALLVFLPIFGAVIGYFIDDNIKETKLERKLRKWV